MMFSTILYNRVSPSPHGEGGLKCKLGIVEISKLLSLPTRGGWIEMAPDLPGGSPPGVPPLTERVD